MAKVEMAMIDHGRQAPAGRVKLMVDTGVRKTLINEEIWKKMQNKAESKGKNLKLKWGHYTCQQVALAPACYCH